jgi:RNA polymerase primary sigma factor
MSASALRPDDTTSRGNSLTRYLSEIRAFPLLTRAEESALAKRIRAGDAEAWNALVCANLRFVVSVAKKYQHQHVPLADLVNEGNLGLMRAAERFDESRGVKFISYAVWWVRQAMAQALAEHANVVRVPLSRAAIVQRIGRRSNVLRHALGREPTDAEIADALDLTGQDVASTLAITRATVSLDAPSDGGDGSALLEVLADDAGAPTDRDVAEADAEDCIESALHQLRPREQAVLRLYFGLGDGEPMTLEEIGAGYGITRERVRQIKDRALARIRRSDLSAALQSLRNR